MDYPTNSQPSCTHMNLTKYWAWSLHHVEGNHHNPYGCLTLIPWRWIMPITCVWIHFHAIKFQSSILLNFDDAWSSHHMALILSTNSSIRSSSILGIQSWLIMYFRCASHVYQMYRKKFLHNDQNLFSLMNLYSSILIPLINS